MYESSEEVEIGCSENMIRERKCVHTCRCRTTSVHEAPPRPSLDDARWRAGAGGQRGGESEEGAEDFKIVQEVGHCRDRVRGRGRDRGTQGLQRGEEKKGQAHRMKSAILSLSCL